jgi:hypothetical protein
MKGYALSFIAFLAASALDVDAEYTAQNSVYCTPYGATGDLCKEDSGLPLCKGVLSNYYLAVDSFADASALCSSEPKCAGFTKVNSLYKFKSEITGAQSLSGYTCYTKETELLSSEIVATSEKNGLADTIASMEVQIQTLTSSNELLSSEIVATSEKNRLLEKKIADIADTIASIMTLTDQSMMTIADTIASSNELLSSDILATRRWVADIEGTVLTTRRWVADIEDKVAILLYKQ